VDNPPQREKQQTENKFLALDNHAESLFFPLFGGLLALNDLAFCILLQSCYFLAFCVILQQRKLASVGVESKPSVPRVSL